MKVSEIQKKEETIREHGNGKILQVDDDFLWGDDRSSLCHVADTLLTHNGGNRRPYRVALDQLLVVVKDNANRYFDTHRDDFLKSEKMDHTQDKFKERFISRITSSANKIIHSTPQILCSLALCDLSIPSSRNLLLRIMTEWSDISKEPMNFHSVIREFSRASRASKREDDKSPTYFEELECIIPVDDGFTRVQQKKERIVFANKATFIAFKYFLRYLWEKLDGIPKEWNNPLPLGMKEWMLYISKSRDRSMSLQQFNTKINNGETFITEDVEQIDRYDETRRNKRRNKDTESHTESHTSNRSFFKHGVKIAGDENSGHPRRRRTHVGDGTIYLGEGNKGRWIERDAREKTDDSKKETENVKENVNVRCEKPKGPSWSDIVKKSEGRPKTLFFGLHSDRGNNPRMKSQKIMDKNRPADKDSKSIGKGSKKMPSISDILSNRSVPYQPEKEGEISIDPMTKSWADQVDEECKRQSK